MPDDSRIVTNLTTRLLFEIFASARKALSAKQVHAEIDLLYQTIHLLLMLWKAKDFRSMMSMRKSSVQPAGLGLWHRTF